MDKKESVSYLLRAYLDKIDELERDVWEWRVTCAILMFLILILFVADLAR